MAYEVNGKTIEADGNGYLVNTGDWDETIAAEIATQEEIGELTEKHWDVMNYLRDEYFNNNANQPNMRNIIKAMKDKWGGKVDSKSLYDLFPKGPDKQAGKVAGLPESRRKGGY